MPRPKPRKLGNPNNQSVRSFQGASAEHLRAERLAKKAPAGQVERVISYDPAAVRRAIEAQTCPWCGRGPYKVLAVHTSKIHGVDKWELRNLAGLTTRDSICSPEFTEGARARAVSQGLGSSGPRKPKQRRPQRWTAAGLARSSANLQAFTESADADVLRAQRVKAAEVAGAGRLARTACKNGHPWTPQTTRVTVTREGREHRVCRACEKERSRQRNGFSGENEIVDAEATILRIQALAAIGYPVRETAERVGLSPWWAANLMKRSKQGAGVIRSTADAVSALYEALRQTPAPESKGARISRTVARKKGWPIPAELDDTLHES